MTVDLRRIADRFAAHGYLALAPALYQRGFKAGCVVRTFRSFFTGSGPAVDDLVAARDYLAADDQCTGKVGSAGFCLGGGFCRCSHRAGFSTRRRPTTDCSLKS
jgi:carboxymethylenebutenolidase